MEDGNVRVWEVQLSPVIGAEPSVDEDDGACRGCLREMVSRVDYAPATCGFSVIKGVDVWFLDEEDVPVTVEVFAVEEIECCVD
ncbi:hypothetical protein GLOTRDRAFT_111719 [Gloeophyllum trabeum ATCC 11539]|uniref:Uncharacterized protein n=1 Tax=Gloeophyllum trabeum (strain ATCC 11539 / FP-39264 / Madison 617) TaxID=670483 RepID=S7Q0Z7_GLOTA|nr:uncharacterized protein GLOTRDRAFT_111719 [Gloeophyllum trabeum ATCC 11539]EPQ53616.1 hypothetical protein GLOTRDRAFT_111719 [Gloeophyllum trabeum ATCC 11539]